MGARGLRRRQPLLQETPLQAVAARAARSAAHSPRMRPHGAPRTQAKTHEKVDSIGEERSIGCHAVIMIIRKDVS